MVLFPVELWHKVFDNLDRPESIAVASTCRTFRSIVRPCFYQDLYADPDELNKYPLTTETAFSLHVMRSRDPELAGFVKHFTLESLSDRAVEYSSIPDEIRHSLPLFVNLRSLCLSVIHIDHGFYDLVAVLPHLNGVCYISCDIAPSLIEDTDKRLADSKITDLTIVNLSDGGGWSAVMPSNPYFLDINRISAEREDIMFSIFDELMDFGRNESLEVLTLSECPFPSNMVDFLKSCHQLRRIELPNIPIALVGLFENLPKNTLTRLEHFSGHAKDAGLFIKGRPIRTVTIKLSSKTPVDALQALCHSTTPVTKLTLLRARHLTPEHLQYAPTTLRQFDLYSVTDTSWLSTLSRFPDIQILTISNFQMSRDQQAAIVHGLSVMCVSLREIVFDAPQEVSLKRREYRWRWRKDGPWELYTE